ncbi:hypothetical protein K461DRAFT_172829 [Myriangium duriaei CBS 260.36]|uniref:Uncharacterized protein n=1 Tax=Myriangium duriaei CBS 260.36 TaxID=1168546 RepID=A0A9P4MFT4_9PEZI|nr:hypothetical protein K461DRAFT_172829 [Myriangium duriaei CBS 260.36]
MEPPPPPEHSKPSPHRFLVSSSSHPSKKFKTVPTTPTNDGQPVQHATKRVKFAENSSEPRPAPRFMLSQNTTEATFTKPTFVNATTSLITSEDPLPEVFSPNRRGQRFVAGGMAAQLQSWVEELRDQATAARGNVSGARESDFSTMIEVETRHGDDVLFITGKDPHNWVTRAMLVQQAGHATNDMLLQPATRIGLRNPTWQVDLDSESWTVAADWKILQ